MAPPISRVLPRVFQSQHSGTSCLLKTWFFLKEPIGGSAPKFSLDSKSQTFVRSMDATLALICAAQGSPLPSFRWLGPQANRSSQNALPWKTNTVCISLVCMYSHPSDLRLKWSDTSLREHTIHYAICTAAAASWSDFPSILAKERFCHMLLFLWGPCPLSFLSSQRVKVICENTFTQYRMVQL